MGMTFKEGKRVSTCCESLWKETYKRAICTRRSTRLCSLWYACLSSTLASAAWLPDWSPDWSRALARVDRLENSEALS